MISVLTLMSGAGRHGRRALQWRVRRGRWAGDRAVASDQCMSASGSVRAGMRIGR